jgi:3-dehydroquinate synthetase
MSAVSLRALMQHDKKVDDNKLRLVLLAECGKAVLRSDVDEKLIMQVLAADQ